MVDLPDIDIDCANREKILDLIEYTSARMEKNNEVKKHQSGIYVTDIPYDPLHKCASIDYKLAERRGYFKIDLLNMSVYSMIKDTAHYESLMSREPLWSLLWTRPDISKNIVHVGGYFDLLKAMQPDSVLKMAAFVSIIRPGKAHLQKQPWDKVLLEVWDNLSTDGYTFRKSHAIAYGMVVKLHLTLLEESLDLFNQNN